MNLRLTIIASSLLLAGCAQQPQEPYWFPEPASCVVCKTYEEITVDFAPGEADSTTGMLLRTKDGFGCTIVIFRKTPDRERTIRHEKQHGACLAHAKGRVEPY